MIRNRSQKTLLHKLGITASISLVLESNRIKVYDYADAYSIILLNYDGESAPKVKSFIQRAWCIYVNDTTFFPLQAPKTIYYHWSLMCHQLDTNIFSRFHNVIILPDLPSDSLAAQLQDWLPQINLQILLLTTSNLDS